MWDSTSLFTPAAAATSGKMEDTCSSKVEVETWAVYEEQEQSQGGDPTPMNWKFKSTHNHKINKYAIQENQN